MNAEELFEAGSLSEAIDEAIADVKRHPTETGRRAFLAELLCFAGDFERADKQIDTITVQEPDAAVTLALFRQLIRAEQARQDFHTAGRLPEYLIDPSPVLKKHLEASISLREGDNAGALERLEECEAERPRVAGTCDGAAFDDIRDLDDPTAAFFEILTSTGKYYWVPFEIVETIEFRPPESPRDLLWRAARMVVRNGPDGEVYVPTLYAGTCNEEDEALKLGRATDWRGEEGEPVRGIGQRVFLVGENDLPILQLDEITFDTGADTTGDAPAASE